MGQVFSTEVPELLQSHFDHLLKSGLSPDIVRERRYRSVFGKTELKSLGFGRSQCRTPAILVPLWGVEGDIVGYQIRPDNPRINPKGKPVKYETPEGASNRFDVPPRCNQGLGNPEVPLWITEGAKKADALAGRDLCSINLTGVWAWRGKNEWQGKTVVSDLDRIALNGRLVYLAFDSDVVTKPQVKAALERFGVQLMRKGATVYSIVLPQQGEEKVGIDDYLLTHTVEDALKLALELEPAEESEGRKRQVPGFVLPNEGVVGELVVDEEGVRKFVVAMGGVIRQVDEFPCATGIFVPLKDALVDQVVHFAATAEPYDSDADLFSEVRGFIHKYVELPEDFEAIAALYVLMAWVYDFLPLVPYLRVIGDPGSGKTRFLDVVGGLCFRAIFASGAVTPAPIFRILDRFRGTLVIDEADFRHSEAWTEIIKIFNVGYKPNNPILRAEPVGKLWVPRGFNVFGPKVIATRQRWKDEALESRCLTATMERVSRRDVPRVLPRSFDDEIQHIRAKLMTFRMRNVLQLRLRDYPNEWVDANLEPRLNELLFPLKALMNGNHQMEEVIADFIAELQEGIVATRRESPAGVVLKAIMDLYESGETLTMKAIAAKAAEIDSSHDFKPEKVGWLTKSLGLRKVTSAAGYRTIQWDDERMSKLSASYGLGPLSPLENLRTSDAEAMPSSEVIIAEPQESSQEPQKTSGVGSEVAGGSIPQTSEAAIEVGNEVSEVFRGGEGEKDADVFLPDGRTVRYRDVIALWEKAGRPKISDDPAEPFIWDLEADVENLTIDRLARIIGLLQRDSKPDQPCCACGSTDYWKRPDGSWVCGQCHPQAN